VNNQDHGKSFRVDLGGDLKADWEKMLSARKITQVAAIDALFRWFIRQDPVVQAMVLGQLPESDDLVKLVLSREKRRQAERDSHKRNSSR
jgi:hypothetical protein